MFKTDRKYKIHWELTDLCNLKCPMCPRTDIFNFCRPVKSIQNTQFFLEDVKEYFPDDFLRKMSRIDFCGNLGDPCITRDFYEICEFFIKNYGITINVLTNGSMRNPSWWKKLGELFAGTTCCLGFHIDGLKDTNHLYRIGANWDKIMANTEAFISGGARADWHYILFKHNQHQIDEAHEIARKMGFNNLVFIDTGRFSKGGIFRYMHPDGEYRNLQQATILVPRIDNPKTTGFHYKDRLIPSKEINRKATISSAETGNNRYNKQNSRFLTTVKCIACKASKQNRFFLDTRGYIAPCCWVSSNDIQRPGNMLKSINIAGKDLENYNIRNRPIEKILHDEIFTEVFKELWESDVLETCRKKCGRNHRNIQSKIQLEGVPPTVQIKQ